MNGYCGEPITAECEERPCPDCVLAQMYKPDWEELCAMVEYIPPEPVTFGSAGWFKAIEPIPF